MTERCEFVTIQEKQTPWVKVKVTIGRCLSNIRTVDQSTSHCDTVDTQRSKVRLESSTVIKKKSAKLRQKIANTIGSRLRKTVKNLSVKYFLQGKFGNITSNKYYQLPIC